MTHLKNLKEKEYLGEGYLHQFVNVDTGEHIFVETTKQEYESLGGVDGHLHNPVMDGYVHVASFGGTIKVDNPDSMLGEGEYCVVNGRTFIGLSKAERARGFADCEVEIKNGKVWRM